MTASVRCREPCGRLYNAPKTPRNRPVSPSRVFFDARHLCLENNPSEHFCGKSGADAGLTRRVWVLVPGLSFIPSATFLIRIWPALRGCGKGRVEPRSAWRRIMNQSRAAEHHAWSNRRPQCVISNTAVFCSTESAPRLAPVRFWNLKSSLVIIFHPPAS